MGIAAPCCRSEVRLYDRFVHLYILFLSNHPYSLIMPCHTNHFSLISNAFTYLPANFANHRQGGMGLLIVSYIYIRRSRCIDSGLLSILY